MVLKLYKLDASPPVRSVFMVIEALKIPDVEMVDVNLVEGEHLKDDYLKLNPQHTIPVLKDGDFVVSDSHAIAAYLVTKYGKDDSLYPVDPQKRALVDQKLHFDSGILFPAGRGSVEPIFFRGEKEFRPENLEKVKKAYDFTEKYLTGSKWLAGDHLTLADICASSSISSMNAMIKIDRSKYPNLSAWLDRVSEQDFYKKGNEPGLKQFTEFLKSKLES